MTHGHVIEWGNGKGPIMRISAPLRQALLRVVDQHDDTDNQAIPANDAIAGLAVALKQSWSPAARATRDHALIFSRLFSQYVSSGSSVDPVEHLTNCYGSCGAALRRLPFLCDLIAWGLVGVGERMMRRRVRRVACGERIDPSELLTLEVMPADEIISLLVDRSGRGRHHGGRRFRSNAEYLKAWFEYIEALKSSRGVGRQHLFRSESESDVSQLRYALDLRSQNSRRQFPFAVLAKKLALTHDEQIILMHVFWEHSSGQPADEEDLLKLIDHTRADVILGESPLSASSTLLRMKVLVPGKSSCGPANSITFELAPGLYSLILHGRQVKSCDQDFERFDSDTILTQVCPTTKLNELILPSDITRIIKDTVTGIKRGSAETLRQWGIGRRMKGPQERFVLLLHGDPGTGKTALAHALAHSFGRLLLTTDVSRILDKWVGESEKRLARMFDEYQEARGRAGSAPVLLLNEADQLLSVRSSVERSVDRMYNQMQNILLERLEEFEGILIATTNLVDNLDPAFSRRLDLKIELPRPGVEARRRLWRVLIPRRLPLAADVNVDSLAEKYPFTGGQIALVIRNAAGSAAARPANKRRVTMSDLVRFAESERRNAFEAGVKNPIGFLKR